MAAGCGDVAPPTAPDAEAVYVDSATCAGCHPLEAESWTGSHHDLAMQHADDTSVLGDFDDASFTHAGVTTRFFRRGEQYWVNTEGPDGELRDYPIAYTFGVEPLQQYLVEFPGGRLQSLTVAWDTDEQRWFTLYPDQRIAADDELHWTGRYQNWNLMCADCHSTHLAKNYDPATDSYDTTWHELNVTCQACHGPGSEHVARATTAGSDWDPEPGETGFVHELRRGEPAPQIESCAPCHSRRRPLTTKPHVAGNYHDDYAIESLRAPLYHADGQVLEEVYVVGSFMQSKMHQVGVGCSDCHDPHGLELWVPGDGVCQQCHTPQAPLERFPTLTQKDYTSPEHHHHPVDSDGARCVNCHMPERTFMQIDERHDHSLRIPRPDLSAAIGTPNACNACHTDQSADWAAAAIAEWTGQEPPPHVGILFEGARTGHPAVASPLASIAHDPDQPVLWRVTALEELSPYPAAGQVKLMAIEDPELLVRAAALYQLEDLPPELLVQRLQPLLSDPARRVRIAAARALAGAPGASLEAVGDEAYARARAELMESFDASADAPSASLNRAVYLADCGDTAGAIAAYRRALFLDRDFLPAVFNLSILLSTSGAGDEARELLEAAIERAPGEGELRYSHGLLMAELGDLEASAASLRAAATRMPFRARVQYNLGLMSQQLDRLPEAEAALRRAAELEPAEPQFAYALSTFFLGQQRFEDALTWALELQRLAPEASGPPELIAEIRRQADEAR